GCGSSGPGSATVGVVPGNGQPCVRHRGRGNGFAAFAIVGVRFDVRERLEEIPSDGDLLYRIREFPVLEPQPNRAARIVTGDRVYAKPGQLGDIQARADRANNLFW